MKMTHFNRDGAIVEASAHTWPRDHRLILATSFDDRKQVAFNTWSDHEGAVAILKRVVIPTHFAGYECHFFDMTTDEDAAVRWAVAMRDH